MLEQLRDAWIDHHVRPSQANGHAGEWSPHTPSTLMTMYPKAHKAHVPYLDQINDLLDEVVFRQAGPAATSAVKRIHQLAIERRAGMPDAEARLVSLLNELCPELSADVIRAFTLYFDLANVAEELHRIRILRKRSTTDEGAARQRETIFDAVATLKARGVPPSDVQQLVHNLCIQPVFTAHPSEAKRRTTRAVLRRLRETLASTDPQQSAQLTDDMRRAVRADLTALWQSDLLRPARPDVISEVERGLFFASTLWTVVPQIASSLREALAYHYPHDPVEAPPPLRFGTWIGGDRDGHPFVTAKVTETALDMMRQTAIEGYLDQCQRLMSVLVMSTRHTSGLEQLAEAVALALRNDPALQPALAAISEVEVPRRWLTVIEHRLQAALRADDRSAYRFSHELEADVSLLVDVLSKCNSRDVVELHVRPWLDTVQAFGLSFAAMDIRQHSGVHEQVVAEVMKSSGICEQYGDLNDEDRTRLLVDTLTNALPLNITDLPGDVGEMLDVFHLLATRIQKHGADTFGAWIVSMTHSASDILCVLWLWTHVWKAVSKSAEPPFLPIVPLFETIQDLERAPQIMESIWEIPAYREYLRLNRNDAQMVMVGYSDSTKDGGYLTASWKLHQAQAKLAGAAEAHGIRLNVFHGRGGALGRGGGPAARAVLSLPPAAVNGAMRVTEQGEILAERYDNPEIARRHLEQVAWATLLVSGDDSYNVPSEFEQAMSAMAEHSFVRYRELVTHPDFPEYFDSATPISEIETLPIGSRPSRRSGERRLEDLRAIPWTFGWTQSRHLIPAWYGLGTALCRFVDEAHGDWAMLRRMYADWRFFEATIDNAELALAKTDLEIARRYSQLCPSGIDDRIWPLIETEYDRCRAAILLLKQQHELLDDTDWLQESIRNRNPSVDPLNLLQIRLLNESRGLAADDATGDSETAETHLLRLTINGIAAGMRTTG